VRWTFGLITVDNPPYLERVINSIVEHGPARPNREIILIGGERTYDEVDHWLPFNESIKPGWLTKKKQIVGDLAKYENLCFMHDYVGLESGWWAGVQAFGQNWNTCMHRVLNQDGGRYRDWCVIFNDAWMDPPIDNAQPPDSSPGAMLDYNVTSWGRWQYYSGAYFCVKKSILRAIPLNLERVQNRGEDVEWSRRLYDKLRDRAFTMNTKSAVRFYKHKNPVPWQARMITDDYRP